MGFCAHHVLDDCVCMHAGAQQPTMIFGSTTKVLAKRLSKLLQNLVVHPVALLTITCCALLMRCCLWHGSAAMSCLRVHAPKSPTGFCMHRCNSLSLRPGVYFAAAKTAEYTVDTSHWQLLDISTLTFISMYLGSTSCGHCRYLTLVAA